MKFNRRKVTLGLIGVLLIGTILCTNILFLKDLRKRTLQAAEVNLSRYSLTLAEQADQSFRSVDLMLSSVGDYLARSGVTDAASYRSTMAGEQTHTFLKEKIKGLPQIDALTMIDTKGKLINFSRFYPVPEVDISDRDYFKALVADEYLDTFISAPVRNRGSGTWTVYLARRLEDPNGQFMGLLLAAMSLQYIENFFGLTSLDSDNAVSLVRQDEVLLASYPHSEDIGRPSQGAGQRALAAGGIVRELSNKDKKMRLVSARALSGYPVVLVVTQKEEKALQDWREMAFLMAAMSLLTSLVVLVSALLIARWWKNQERLVHAAQAANATKMNFMAMMSHEIRTPMNAVLGLSAMLLETELHIDQRSSVKAIYEAGDNLLELLNDILDFSKLESGQLALEEIAFAPDDVVQNAIDIIGPRAIAKGLAIRSVADPELPPALVGDSGRIRQVIMNLLSNAVKFTECGEVTIHARCVSRDDEHALVEWAITDTGIGIAAEKIGSLFEDFVQADNSISRRFGGSGLGLAICKRLIERMGGQIKVESRASIGSTFSFSLEVRIAEKIELIEKGDQAPNLKRRIALLNRPLRILIADDNAANRIVAIKMLREFDIDADMASDGNEAVAAACRFDYDLILMDVRMPEMDGLQATRAIRASQGRSQTIPIIAFTANAFAEDVKVCLESGMNAFVAKPVSKIRLVEAILNSLPDIVPVEQQVLPMPSIAPGQIETPAIGGIEGGYFRTVIAEIGAESAVELLALFVTETADTLKRLRQLSPKHDVVAIEIEAHSLKSAAAMFDVSDVEELARRLERDASSISADDYAEVLAHLEHLFTLFLGRYPAMIVSPALAD